VYVFSSGRRCLTGFSPDSTVPACPFAGWRESQPAERRPRVDSPDVGPSTERKFFARLRNPSLSKKFTLCYDIVADAGGVVAYSPKAIHAQLVM